MVDGFTTFAENCAAVVRVLEHAMFLQHRVFIVVYS